MCSATWSTEALSSSMAALVSSRVDAWLWEPSASFCAFADISPPEDATVGEFSWMAATMPLRSEDMPFRACASSPISSFPRRCR